MTTIANVLVGLVALLHLYFLVLEMFLWTTPTGRRVFRTTPEFAHASKALAANQGLYNGFLAAGLFWGLALGAAGLQIKVFFLACVLIAGIYGMNFENMPELTWRYGYFLAIGLMLVIGLSMYRWFKKNGWF